MSSTILIRRSSTAGSVPTTAQLSAGELAINLADKKIYTNTGSSIIELGTIASTMDVEGALGVDGDFDVNTNKFTVASGTGNTSVAGTLDVTGNTQVDGDFTVLGAISIEEPTANSHAATKFYVDQAVTDLIGTAGSALDTLGELADALNDDANFSATVTSSLATKLNLAGGTMTGNIVMGANKVTSTATPTAADDLTRKGYIDALYGSTASAAASATAAETAETGAENARDAAQTAQTAAETAETNAASSASSASTSATNASNSASAASTSATSASNSASSASTSASNAATSATNAENAYDNFDDRYLGAKASDPTVDNDGDALITGAMYFDSSNNVMKVYSGTEWQNASSSIEGIKSDFVYTATASQTVFSGSDDNTDTLVIDKAGLVNVYLNGVRLTDADYTIDAPGNSVTLGSGATVGDIVEIEVFGNFAGQSGADVAITGGSITGLTELSTGTFTSTGIDDNATSTAITIDSSQNVGIGTSSPTSLGGNITTLEIKGGATDRSGGFYLKTSDNSQNAYGYMASGLFNIGTGTSNPMSFIIGGTERARIDSSGNLLVGKSSTNFNTDGFQAFSGGFVHATATQGTANSGTVVTVNRKSTDGSIVDLKKDGSTVGSIGAYDGRPYLASTTVGIRVSNALFPSNTSGVITDGTMNIGGTSGRFKDLYLSGGVKTGGGGTNKTGVVEFIADSTRAKIEGGYQSGGGGYLKFNTDTTGGSDLERMRIDNNGSLLVNTTAPSFNPQVAIHTSKSYGLEIKADTGSTAPMFVRNANGVSGSRTQMFFMYDSTTIGSIGSTSTSTSYNTSSDERLKESIQDTTHTVDINDIQVREFDWKVDGSHQRYGFIAQELETVYPEAVHSPEDTDEMKSVDYSKLVPLLVKEIQTLKAEIKELKA